MFIVYEGLDQVGKTTIRKLIERRRFGKDVGIDRFIGSNLVYGNLFDRYTKEEKLELEKADIAFKIFDPILIYLVAPIETILERIEKDKHEHIDIDLLRKTSNEFEEYYQSCPYKHKLKLDTSKYSIEEVVNLSIKFIENVENE